MFPWLVALVALLAIRLVSLGLYPLMDTTEARYGEMARIMVETGNWLTPMFDYGVPFMGKPPLHTWVTAAGAWLLGNSEFALRLPHWLAGVAVVWLVWQSAPRFGLRPLVSAFVLASMVGFITCAGIIQADMELTLGLTIAMLATWRVWQGDRVYSYWLAVGLAIGLLAKGPVVLALWVIAILPWLIRERGLGRWLGSLNIVGFLVLLVALSVPWYVAAEIATPGFLRYFILSEHFGRFLVSGYTGDLYGHEHVEIRGTIIVFWLLNALPWSALMPFLIWRHRKNLAGKASLLWFLGSWAAAPVVLFALAANIMIPYALPGLPAAALLFDALMDEEDVAWMRPFQWVMPAVLTISLVVLIFFVAGKRINSDRDLLAGRRDYPVYFLSSPSFSGRYYTQGQAKLVNADGTVPTAGAFYLMVRPGDDRTLVDARHCVLQRTGKDRAIYLCAAS
jgi:4-amino-4-deoxy-L-arabinose transferase-like glycosyltransferase